MGRFDSDDLDLTGGYQPEYFQVSKNKCTGCGATLRSGRSGLCSPCSRKEEEKSEQAASVPPPVLTSQPATDGRTSQPSQPVRPYHRSEPGSPRWNPNRMRSADPSWKTGQDDLDITPVLSKIIRLTANFYGVGTAEVRNCCETEKVLLVRKVSAFLILIKFNFSEQLAVKALHRDSVTLWHYCGEIQEKLGRGELGPDIDQIYKSFFFDKAAEQPAQK